MITLYPLPQEAIDTIQRRIADEQDEFYFYISAMSWCRLNGYENASNYFDAESRGEEYHYKRLITYLTSWNTEVNFSSVVGSIRSFKSLQDIFEQAYRMEFEMYKKYEANCLKLFPICQNTYSLLQDFVRIQNESVISAADKVTKMENYLKTDPGLMTFDKEVFENYSNIVW
jgi:ferritin